MLHCIVWTLICKKKKKKKILIRRRWKSYDVVTNSMFMEICGTDIHFQVDWMPSHNMPLSLFSKYLKIMLDCSSWCKHYQSQNVHHYHQSQLHQFDTIWFDLTEIGLCLNDSAFSMPLKIEWGDQKMQDSMNIFCAWLDMHMVGIEWQYKINYCCSFENTAHTNEGDQNGLASISNLILYWK